MSAVVTHSDRCLESARSQDARDRHARTVQRFVQVGIAHLLDAPISRTAVIAAYCAIPENLQPTPTTHAAWARLEARGAAFEKFIRRNQQWVRATLAQVGT